MAFLAIQKWHSNHFKRSPVTISEAIIEFEDLLRKDKSLEEALTLMGENLIKGEKRKYRISVARPLHY